MFTRVQVPVDPAPTVVQASAPVKVGSAWATQARHIFCSIDHYRQLDAGVLMICAPPREDR
jgi:hypothetical protein